MKSHYRYIEILFKPSKHIAFLHFELNMLPVIKKILNEILVCTKLQILFFTDIFLIKIVKFVKFVSLKGLLYKIGEKVLFKKF